MKSKLNLRFGLVALMIVLAAASRLLPHPPNFTPIGGMALFGAAYFSRKYLAFLIPLLALWLSDLVLNNVIYPMMYPEYYDGAFAWGISPYVYGSVILITLLGFGLLKKIKMPRLLAGSVLASALFFLVTNFGVWASGMTYPMTMDGLMACYAAGIPFFWNTLAGDLFYVAVLFGSYELVQQQLLSKDLVKVRV